MRMGGLVQDQIANALLALREHNVELAREVIARDHMVNFMDVQGEEAVMNLMARRQPMASDLRMVMSLNRAIADLERVGDEARRISRMTIELFATSSPRPSERLLRDVHTMARLATSMLREALDAMARLDVVKAVEIAKGDAELDAEFQSALRRLATYMMEDSRTIGNVISVTFVLKSLERVGDHAKNIAEYVVFVVKGKDVRHVSPESLDLDELDA
ncbi:MAG: phosphate signaling complex protein PhoU [Gammaproteobacteria bacterium]|nr:phosphate signaling complex protein PhoU [Gammaproteobacteria bacterium]